MGSKSSAKQEFTLSKLLKQCSRTTISSLLLAASISVLEEVVTGVSTIGPFSQRVSNAADPGLLPLLHLLSSQCCSLDPVRSSVN